MGAIDIGSAAINRDYSWSGGNTLIERTNPANDTGFLDTFEFWAYQTMQGVKVGTFYGSGLSWTSRDVVTIGTVSPGSKQTFTGKHVAVSANDVIGAYYSTGNLKVHISGGGGYIYVSPDVFGAGIKTYTAGDADGIVSLNGAGATPSSFIPKVTMIM